ncbi:MAG: UvrD-helicase domain-containing protein [Cyclobacteriaceae bacterium]|nr:UvrD-helicase domain-containing protein [Cyclobacteriaceae bacterium]
MNQKPFVVYRSSAGSGKTYTLAKEYILLALKRPTYFKHILAVTFTNKATAEMKSRIVEYLNTFSKGEYHDMGQELMCELGLDEGDFQTQCKEVLSMILHNYSQFSISTIDAFFQKVIRSFAKEVGLHGGFQLELDQDDVLDKVIDDVFEEIGKDDLLTNWLVNFAEKKVEEGKSWDIKKDILRFAKELFSEAYKGKEKELFKIASNRDFFKKFLNQLNKVISDYQSSAQKYAQEAFDIMDEHELNVGDFARKIQGPAGYFHKIIEPPYDVSKLQLNSYQLPALDTIEAWHTKTSDNKERIVAVVEDKLMDHFNKTVQFINNGLKEYATAQVAQKNMYAFGVLLDVTSKLKVYKEREGIMLISDANSFLKKIVEDNDAPFVYEKTGSFYRNYLIDEFQDTSGFQWQNFSPLIYNSLSEGNKNLLVGDVKQSIYRWRGGDWQLLQNKVEEQIGSEYSEIKQLNNNYRSAGQVIAVNNTLFSQGAKVLSDLFLDKIELEGKERESIESQAKLIEKAYADVAQLQPTSKKEKFDGCLSFSFVKEDKDEEKKWKEIVLERIPLLMENLQDRGVKISEVAFLVRGSKDEKLIADYLIDYNNSEKAKKGYSYNIVSNESLMLESSRSVQLLIHALQYLNNNNDQIALANLVYPYQEYTHGMIIPDEIFNSSSLEQFLPKDFYSQQLSLRKLPLVDLLEVLIRMFGLNNQEGEFTYIQSFIDVVLEYGKQHIGDITSFLQWWNENNHKQFVKLPEGTNAARVMTIHKSKGLQFKAVIVPFCNWKIDHETSSFKENRMWISSDKEPFSTIPFLPVNYGSILKYTEFDTKYYAEMLQAYMDNFNLLYVALTRAEDYLFTFSEEQGKSIKCVSDLMFEVLKSNYNDLGGSWNEENNIFRFGQFEDKAVDDISNKYQEKDSTFQYISNPWQKKLAIKYNSQAFFNTTTDQQQSSINYGNLIHELMARIITIDQLPKALDAMKFEGLITKIDKEELRNTVSKMFQNEEVSSWFDKKWKVKTEVPVIPKTGEMNRMDRVMIYEENAVVVDYKTGMVRDEDSNQVKNYVQLLSEMGYKQVKGYLLYIDKMEVIAVK